MKIALLGYGRMGKIIERVALERGHEIVIKTSEEGGYDIQDADIAIDFSVPTAAFFNIVNCFKHQVPVVSGTTGWLHNYKKALKICEDEKGAFIYASNFSLGVNIFFELNSHLAKLMNGLKQYTVAMEEIHHTQKLDAPSGTAITLAESIIEKNDAYGNWKLNEASIGNIPIHAKRIPDVPGTHAITYNSPTDSIKIEHIAHNREGFALGAVIAAEWLLGKTGVYTMKDVLNIG
ncbi:4-hydroxy-tetrahydrodipicolinate reductase [Hanstruepera neustonica]|uniref:4-hydroxy-tetrahydrodipicolinate reductase n=1 Tax=Hanstruepera neustonica TaxID=1445657 RepID=A0A2K1DW30_9FLAO|nr:4-hydroxy-tetrahydrodipicolinate reductase [Hanstruepera neustonica]PNQ72234.1 4-hydroxy-tetrahydrodipicolinate reductase [Hanstruepera neustonica]